MRNTKYRKRVVEASLLRYLRSFPVVGLTGPRQSGKSTLLQHMLKHYRYVTFDDPKNIDYFEQDPEGFMQEYHDQVIFDEAQYVPKLFHYLKMAVDNDRHNYGKFIVTGSSQFAMVKGISESLAGRIGLLSLLPFQYSELPASLRSDSVYKGSYPELVDRCYDERMLWYSAYFDTYLNKDVRALSNIGDLRDFRRFVMMLAANVTQLLDMTAYAKEIGVSVPTVKRWLSILEASYIIFLLPPYFKNYGKRLTKSPKLYFYDTGLATYLVGVDTKVAYDKGPMAGAIFENYVVSEILKKNVHLKTEAELYGFRTSDKLEIDLILDHKTRKEFVEIKQSASFKVSMLDTMKKFIDKNEQGYLLYNGKAVPYHGNIDVIPYGDYLLLS